MSKNFLKKVGISLIVLACVGGIVLKSNLTNENNVDANTSIETNNNDELENTYIDDGYEAPSEEDLEYSQEVEENIINEDVVEEIENKNTTEKVDTDNNNNGNKEDSLKVTEKTGLFQGFADSNFVEVKIGDEYFVYQVSSTVKDALSKKNIDDTITFNVSTVNGQSTITDIK